MNCRACGAGLPDGARFCAACGSAVTPACQGCGAELSPGARFCAQCGMPVEAGAPAAAVPAAALPAPAAGPVAERRVTSVLFGDLVGFTTLSESRDSEEVRELLSRYFDTAREIVGRYGGTIEKFIGDAVMAVWGVPSTHEDDAERAVRAGLDLTESVAAFGESVGAPGLAMRVGVVTGEVAVTLGATGQGMVAGDAVNTAARVQAQAHPGTVWVDATTRSLAGGSIEFRDAGSHQLKGKAEPLQLYAATAVMGGVGQDGTGDRVHAPLVGRRHEMALLKESMHVATEEHRPRLVVLSGDAGVGKSRLGSELYNYIDGLSAPVLWHRGRCLAYGDGVAFSALTAAVRGRIGASEDDSEPTVLAKLEQSLDTYLPDAAERARIAPALINLLGLPGATGGLTRADLFSAWLIWFERLGSRDGRTSVVWVVDDAQYADDGLLDFIEHLTTVAQAPLLIVLLARPELLARRPSLVTLRRTTLIGVESLSRTDVASLFDSLVDGLPSDVRDALVTRAEGNPLFAIETVRALHDQGLMVDGPTRRPGAVRLAPGVDASTLRSLPAPAGLQVLVTSRLDLLPAAERSLLAIASVVGQTFSREALQAVSGLSDSELETGLRELVGRDLLTTVTDRLSADEGQYVFVQSVVRTVAYQTQSKRDRLQRHLDVVRYFESLPDSDSELDMVITQHLRDALSLAGTGDAQSGDLAARLARWLERSAARSISVGAPRDGARALTEALTLTADPDDMRRIRVAAATAAADAGDTEQSIELAAPVANGELGTDPAAAAGAVAVMSNAARQAGTLDRGWAFLEPYFDHPEVLVGLPAATAARLCGEVAGYLAMFARHDESLAWLDRTVRLAEESGVPRVIAQALANNATAHARRGRVRLSLVLLRHAADYAREHGLIYELGMVLLNTFAFEVNTHPQLALEAGEEAFKLFEQSGSPTRCYDMALNLAKLLLFTGSWDDVLALAERPIIQSATPVPYQLAIMAFFQGMVAFARGVEPDRATLAASADAGDETLTDTPDHVFYTLDRALLLRTGDDLSELPAVCRRVVEVSQRFMMFEDDFPFAWACAVEWTLDAGDLVTARELLDVVDRAAAPTLSPLLAAELARLRGTLHAADPAGAAADESIEQDLLDAIGQLDALGAAPDRARTQAVLGRWLVQRGRSTDAAPHLAAARATYAELGAETWLRELETDAPVSAAG